MTTIRRNSHKKIRGIVADAIRVQTYDHSGPEPKRVVEPASVDSVLDDWFEWTREGSGSSWFHTGNRYVRGADGKVVPGMVRDVRVLVLAYHSNRGIEVVMEEGEPREAR